MERTFTGTTGSTEAVLVDGLRRREQRAMTELYDRYSAMLFGLIKRVVREEEVAEDVLQETFVKIWRSFAQYDARKGALATWLMSVARSVAIDKVRSRDYRNSTKNQSLDDVVHTVERVQSTTFGIDGIGVERLLKDLRPEQRQVLELVYYGGYTHEEAARELCTPLGTVKTRLRTALIQLRKTLEAVES